MMQKRSSIASSCSIAALGCGRCPAGWKGVTLAMVRTSRQRQAADIAAGALHQVMQRVDRLALDDGRPDLALAQEIDLLVHLSESVEDPFAGIAWFAGQDRRHAAVRRRR